MDCQAEAAEVDLTGEVCPMAFVRAKVHLDRLAPGQTLTLVLKGGDQIRSVPRSLRDEGHVIEAVERREDDRFALRVRKGD